MSTREGSRSGGGSVLILGAILLIGAYVILNAVSVGMANVPVAEAVSEHATTAHTEASIIQASYDNKEYQCLRVYNTLEQNRLLYRLTYEGMALEGGILTTTSGKNVTAYLRTRAGWDRVIVRDGFVLKATDGACEGLVH